MISSGCSENHFLQSDAKSFAVYLSKPNSTDNLIARIDTIERSNFIKKALSNSDKIIVRCIYCEKFKKWIHTTLVN